MKHILIALLSAALVLGWVQTSEAASGKDLEVLAKAVGFIQGGPTGSVPVAVLYDPGVAASSAEADAVSGLLAGGVGGGKVTLTDGGKVEIGALPATPGAVFFVTQGLGAHHGAILAKVTEVGGLTLSTDEACLLAGACVFVVKTEPSVDILVSSKAAGATNTELASAFSMMITKK
ncbi:MAG TPA: hypothetical protein DDX54_01315 [Rhodospirillaceae bacterium]|jgi:hypothetical protein|nr:hypothetical protein [Alphaproteobacteria bacterium]HBH26032.1 hypothetical protein [Rhodospirillaceae bacterium]